MHSSHTTPNRENDRADRTLAMARVIRDRLRAKEDVRKVHDLLVPDYVDEDDFQLALGAAIVLLK